MHWVIERLSQNASSFITKQDILFITKDCKILLQNVAAALLENTWIISQNAADVTKCIYY